MENLQNVLIPIIAILSAVALPIALGMFFAIKSLVTKHSERMELIKQGIVPPEEKKAIPNKYRALRNGFLCIGVALGLIIGLVISWVMNLQEDQAFWVVVPGVLLFLGIAYVAFYVMTKKNEGLDGNIE